MRHFNALAMHWQQYDVVVNKKGKQLREICSVKGNLNYQFNFCCNTCKKQSSPPVEVRYNSITAESCISARSNLFSELTPNSHCHTLNVNTDLSKFELKDNCLSKNVCEFEGSSKKESLAFHTSTSAYLQPKDLHGDSILHSKHDNTRKYKSSPIHPIAVTDCRSRLRAKLFPPDNVLLPSQHPKQFSTSLDKMLSVNPHYGSTLNKSVQKELCKFGCNDNFRAIDKFSSYPRTNDYNSELGKTLSKPHHESYLLMREKVGKSFPEGSLLSSSLLGPRELTKVVPNREVTVFVGTWNMNGHIAPKQLRDFVLPVSIEYVPDIVTIGTQETTTDRFDWDATIQENLGPSHVLFHSTSLGTLHLTIFIRRELIWYCSAPEDSSMSVRTGSAFRTKGAVAISFSLFGTSMLFVTSHLTAHQEKVKERVADVKRIIHTLDLPKNLNLRHKSKDVTQNFDNVFWCGDLNFRLSEPRENLLEWIQNTKFPLPSHLPHGLMHTDQLSSILSDGATFKGFMEANITFPPTYKYDPGTQHFDTSYKQRAPAYTDRILYKFRQSQGMRLRCQRVVPGSQTNRSHIQCLLYDSVPTIMTSDHKPVWALFKTSIRPGTDVVPLAAGLFNRDVYLEGIKRRLHNQCSESSAVCSIQ